MSGMKRVLAILDVFSRERPSWSPDEINQALGYSRPTGYRYVKELVGAGLLQRTTTGRYSLGPRIIELDYEIRQSDPILLASLNVMAELCARTRLTAVLSAMYGQRLIDIHHVGPTSDAPPFPYARGRPRSLFRGAAPKVILGYSSRAALVRIYRAFPAEIAAAGMGDDWGEFRKGLTKIRKAGYYMSVGEIEPHICGAAVPILSPEGEVLAALALAGEVSDFERIGNETIHGLLLSAAAGVMAKLG
jgi:DNA-binding IclR family transcriptional regulator